MSEQEKSTIIATVEKKAKRFMVWFGIIHGLAMSIVFFTMLEQKTQAVFQTPAKQIAAEKRDDSVFAKHDSIHVRHNGFFATLFNHVDTSKRKH